MSEQHVDSSKRTWIIASSCVGAVGAGFAVTPFVSSFEPSERARAAGAAVEADISGLAAGEKMTVEWRGKPVWIINRTKEMLDALKKSDDKVSDPKSDKQMQPEYCRNETRSIKPEIFVAVGICTHFGCSPTEKFKTGADSGIDADWQGGFLCPCHGSTFDMAGRVYKNKPAPTNLEVPVHKYLGDTKIVIGVSQDSREA